MRSALGAVHDVVNLEPAGRAASRRLATPAIATPHEADDARRNVLRRTRGNGGIEIPDVLRIAVRTLDGRGVDRDSFPGAILPALLAALAHRDRDLELRATG